MMVKGAVIRAVYLTRKVFHLSRYFFDAMYSKLFYKKNGAVLYHNDLLVSKQNLCIFSHYDPDNIIDPYVINYLTALYACDCDIIFISTCAHLNETERNKINTICKKIIVKKNRGLDFGAYKLGIENEANLNSYEKIILANDSVYGPLFDLNNIIAYGDKHKLDMWGATDSYMIKYHIQSYFVVVAKSLFSNSLFKKFWKGVYYLGLKNNIIIRYEIGMSQFFLKNGFKLGAYCPCPLFNNRIKHDPSHHSWDKLISNYQYPFIKRMLIHNNPYQIKINHWRSFIGHVSSFDTNLITQHLARISCQK